MIDEILNRLYILGFFWWASAEFSSWSSFWFCKTSGARRSETEWGGEENEKTRMFPSSLPPPPLPLSLTPTPLVASFDSPQSEVYLSARSPASSKCACVAGYNCTVSLA